MYQTTFNNGILKPKILTIKLYINKNREHEMLETNILIDNEACLLGAYNRNNIEETK